MEEDSNAARKRRELREEKRKLDAFSKRLSLLAAQVEAPSAPAEMMHDGLADEHARGFNANYGRTSSNNTEMGDGPIDD